MIEGRCLCGSVTIRLTEHRPEVGACHCDMCRRWTGGVYVMFTAPPEAVQIEGPVRRYRSSSFAERAFWNAVLGRPCRWRAVCRDFLTL